MKEKLFKAEQFTPTKWDSAEQKAKFANQFVRLIERGFQFHDFPKWFYNRLSNTFGHIAHYNQLGFWETWFENQGQQLAFLRHTATCQICGDPAFTYSDVERALQGWLKKNSIFIHNLELSITKKHEQHERSEYERLSAKFGTVST